MDLAALNNKYTALSLQERVRDLFSDFGKVLFTSSFGTTAAVSLHLLSNAKPGAPVYFLDTTYHFPETLAYKATLAHLLNLEIITLKGDVWRNKFTRDDHTWKKDPDLCCSINKVEPLNAVMQGFEIWVSGLMGSQNEHRKNLNIFEAKNGIIKFYPLIDITESDAYRYMDEHNLPHHPLRAKGYNSIGCTHCTVAGQSREGRWIDKSKTECGLHN